MGTSFLFILYLVHKTTQVGTWKYM